MIKIPEFVIVLRLAAQKWNLDRCVRLAAALAFFAGLSLAPLLLLALAIAEFSIQSSEGLREFLILQIGPRIGLQAANELLRDIVAPREQNDGLIASLISFGVLLFSASALFWQLQDALNTIWNVPIRERLDVRHMVIGRIRALVVVVTIGVTLITVGLLGPLIGQFETDAAIAIPFLESVFPLLEFLISFVLFTLIFSVIFRRFPTVRVRTTDTWLGSIVTAVLFELGITALGFYFTRFSFGSAYGAAGSLLVVLVWTFLTMQIILFGAEITYVYAHRHGTRRIVIEEPGLSGQEIARLNKPSAEARRRLKNNQQRRDHPRSFRWRRAASGAAIFLAARFGGRNREQEEE